MCLTYRILLGIVAYNCPSELAKCIECAKNYDLVVVQNPSNKPEDRTAEVISEYTKRYNNVEAIYNQQNVGHHGGCNQIIDYAVEHNYKYVLLLNPDCYINPQTIPTALKCMQEHRADICGIRLLFPDGNIQHAGVAFNDNGIPYHIGYDEKDTRKFHRCREVDAVTFAFAIISREVFKKIRLDIENFTGVGLYTDIDYCLTAKEHGFKIWYCGEAYAIHEEHKTMKNANIPVQDIRDEASRNLMALMLKHFLCEVHTF